MNATQTKTPAMHHYAIAPGVVLAMYLAAPDELVAVLRCNGTLSVFCAAEPSQCRLATAVDTSLWMGRTSFDVRPEHVNQIAAAFGLPIKE